MFKCLSTLSIGARVALSATYMTSAQAVTGSRPCLVIILFGGLMMAIALGLNPLCGKEANGLERILR